LNCSNVYRRYHQLAWIVSIHSAG